MASIAVVGGTGAAGRAVVREAVARGHEVRVLSRHAPDDGARVPGAAHHRVDLLAPDDGTAASAPVEVLDAALAGVHAVVDASNGMSPGAMRVFTVGARRLADAAHRTGVARVVVLSIVNVDQGDYGYYRAKAEQERVLSARGVPTTVVRATQFHEFLELFLGRGGRLGRWARLGLLPVPRGVRFQPIALTDVARALVDAAEGTPPGGGVPGPGPDATTVTIGGPEVLDAREMARAWRAAHGSRRPVVGVPLPGPLGEFFRAGHNLVPDRRYGTLTYREWLRERA
ncbi:NAD(P)H-binding protein [Cellulosimicrobium cellulans]|uniref:SDR family oxidoreductase n=1 Tax=Cellulosimicrobium cellulans TaxID=1710 RepID=UPI00196298CD|nr:NAD(P)H-binding protein [Cellulosimicrobium cellulans]MBN0039205.1 NAD(P)H-binding protein [Cellulosimicrobium cellulans]